MLLLPQLKLLELLLDATGYYYCYYYYYLYYYYYHYYQTATRFKAKEKNSQIKNEAKKKQQQNWIHACDNLIVFVIPLLFSLSGLSLSLSLSLLCVYVLSSQQAPRPGICG